eukprot:maker-scaffold202_size261857-snap-gene-0.14 protein:Tk10168 transcript:maker-scaffold202_size261857-snap-gene-0.14-mRNA-1 annotation:"hypothetical protein CGI_10009091"
MSSTAASSSRPVAFGMKGKIASRAHSFKENLLEALGHHSHDKGTPSTPPPAEPSPRSGHTSEDSSEMVVEAVRKAVLVLVNQIHAPSQSNTRHHLLKSNQLHNSLPDISSPELESHHHPSQTSNGCSQSSPPRLPKRKREDLHLHYHQHHHHDRQHRSRQARHGADAPVSPPPLPPKHGAHYRRHHHRDSLNLGQSDWFSNPLFDHHQSPGGFRSSPFAGYDSSLNLPSPHGLDTTLPDDPHGFPYIDEVPSPLNLSRDSCFGDEIATTETLPSSPSFGSNDFSLRDEGHNSLSSGIVPPPLPPALPKKEYKKSKTSIKYTLADAPPTPNSSNSLGSAHGPLSTSHSFDLSSRNKPESQFPSGVFGLSHAPFLSRSERRCSDGINGAPPPLPPKKRDILNYMELLGQSWLPSREDLMQSLAQTQMLLQNVWAENYHEFGEFIPDNSAFNFPPAQDLFTRNIDLSRLPVGIPMQFPETLALPPKKNRPQSGKHSSNASHHPLPPVQAPPLCRPTSFDHPSHHHYPNRERVIPIVRESDGTTVLPHPHTPTASHIFTTMATSSSSSKRFSSESAVSSSNASMVSGASDHHIPPASHGPSLPASHHPHHLPPTRGKEYVPNGSITSGCSDRDRLEDGGHSS